MNDGTVLYIEEVRTGKNELAAVSIRKYPATRDLSSIATAVPSYARSDSGDGVIVLTPPEAAPHMGVYRLNGSQSAGRSCDWTARGSGCDSAEKNPQPSVWMKM